MSSFLIYMSYNPQLTDLYISFIKMTKDK